MGYGSASESHPLPLTHTLCSFDVFVLVPILSFHQTNRKSPRINSLSVLYLPHVTRYGEHGYEMINITYSGETTLIATKVTGDRNVPRGEITFTVDLSPQIQSSSSLDGQYVVATNLEPIVLDAKAQKQWGKKYLPRYAGKGRVASENFANAQWMEGQLILVGRFFSFAWVPIGHQIFFGRPSSDLILTMLKEAKEEELRKRDDVSVMRSMADDMLEETYWTEREDDAFHCGQEGCFE
jgi:hypothetical protein